jgi:hypothetical protein
VASRPGWEKDSRPVGAHARMSRSAFLPKVTVATGQVSLLREIQSPLPVLFRSSSFLHACR